MKVSIGGLTVLILSLALTFFTYAYSLQLWSYATSLKLSVTPHAWFIYAFAGGLLLSLLFVRAHGYFTILTHELTHNFWAVMTLCKPTALNVKSGHGGTFAYKGRKNIMTVLSPYFFPLITLFIFPLYFIISPQYLIYYYAALGITLGASLAVAVKQAHPSQPDLQIYGIVPSYLIIIFFQIFILGLMAAFVAGGQALWGASLFRAPNMSGGYSFNFERMKRTFLALGFVALGIFAAAQERWQIRSEREIVWIPTGQDIPHSDFIEQSGRQISVISFWSVDENGHFGLSRKCIWPMLRIVPDDTHCSFIREFDVDIMKLINVGGNRGFDYRSLNAERVDSVKLKGYIEVYSRETDKLSVVRRLFPSMDKPVWCEQYVITNISPKPLKLDIPVVDITSSSRPEDGVGGQVYDVRIKNSGSGHFVLEPGGSLEVGLEIEAKRSTEQYVEVDLDKEFEQRESYLNEIAGTLMLKTPDEVLNTMFAFAKIRATESVFETSGGLMHAPGGGNYYAAIWANDQAEYVNPFFPFVGNVTANGSALNSYRHFARFMNDGYRPLPSSIVAEGRDIWAGAGDRGDAAMIAYGASRYALARGDRREAEELWPLIEWSIEYCRRQVNASGVVASDSDELEGRFPSGDANLVTSSLYYDALVSASYLSKELGKPYKEYGKEAVRMRAAIEKHFGAGVEGFETYRYYEGNDVLRAWICMPLSVGIYDRADETAKALFSPRLWTDDGLATEAGEVTFWDRSTLYALRGIFAAGYTEKALDYLKKYSSRRLLGDHVPYAVEAFPEGGQAQLSAESGLYGRIFTEGLFGIRPTGLRSFALTPRLPSEWDKMSLERIKAFGGDFSVSVSREKGKLRVAVTDAAGKKIVDKTIKEGETISVKL